MVRIILVCSLLLVFVHLSYSVNFADKIVKHVRNITNSRNRKPKYLIYNSGGSIRMLCGFLAPTFIPKWQSINCLNAWSVGFNMPAKPSDWYDKYKGNINFHQNRSSKKLSCKYYNSRKYFYDFLEKKFKIWGRHSHTCILRTICEINEAPIIHNGLLGELLHTLFTPSDAENIGEEFKIAKRAGQFGANCMEIYSNCPYGHGLLEKYSVLGLFTSREFYNTFL